MDSFIIKTKSYMISAYIDSWIVTYKLYSNKFGVTHPMSRLFNFKSQRFFICNKLKCAHIITTDIAMVLL